MFVFIMALGEDYNILLMTRIREEAATLPLRQAVVAALGTTGTTITSAGLVLAGTFGILAIATSGQVRQMALGSRSASSSTPSSCAPSSCPRVVLLGGGTGGRRACSPSALVATAGGWSAPVLAAPAGPGPDHPRRHVPERPPVFSNRRGLEHGRRAVAPARAHHGQRRHRARGERLHLDPVRSKVSVTAAIETEPSPTETSTDTLPRGSGWHRGMRSEVAFAAWTPAHRAASMASWPSRRARAHAGRRLRRARCSEPRPGAGWAPCR